MVDGPLVFSQAFFFHTLCHFLVEISPNLMGTSGLEPPTSRLSGVRSNHLSYAPIQNCKAILNIEFDFEVNDLDSASGTVNLAILHYFEQFSFWFFSSFLNLIPFAVPDVFDNRFFLLLVSCILLLRWWR